MCVYECVHVWNKILEFWTLTLFQHHIWKFRVKYTTKEQNFGKKQSLHEFLFFKKALVSETVTSLINVDIFLI